LVANRGTVSVRKQGVPADFSDNPDATVPPPPPGGHVPPPPKPPKTPKELKDSEVRM
jgi:hypothetical protein